MFSLGSRYLVYLVSTMSRTEITMSSSNELEVDRIKIKLHVISRTASLLVGFALVALVEMDIDNPSAGDEKKKDMVPRQLLDAFIFLNTILVVFYILALMISVTILPYVDDKLLLLEMRPFIKVAWLMSTVFGMFLFLSEIAVIASMKFYHYSASMAAYVVVPAGIVFIAFSVMFYRKVHSHKYGRRLASLRNRSENSNDVEDIHII